MQALILASDDGWHIRQIEKALKKNKISSIRVPYTELGAAVASSFNLKSRNNILDDVEYIFLRIIPGGSLEQIILRMDILNRMAALGKTIINKPSVIEKTVDKYYTQFLLSDAGLPTPETFVTEDFTQAMEFYEKWEDIILKPIFGSLGKGIVRITDEDTAYRVFRAWQQNNFVFYLQRYIEHGNSDIRVFVCDGKIISASKRCGENWKTNIARGAESQRILLPDSLKNLALKAAEVLELDYTGIDIILKDGNVDEPFLIEVNSIPGWHGLQQVTDFNIAEKIIKMMIEKYEK